MEAEQAQPAAVAAKVIKSKVGRVVGDKMMTAQFNAESHIGLQLKFVMLGPAVRLRLRMCESVVPRTGDRTVECRLEGVTGLHRSWDAGALGEKMKEALDHLLHLPRFGDPLAADGSNVDLPLGKTPPDEPGATD